MRTQHYRTFKDILSIEISNVCPIFHFNIHNNTQSKCIQILYAISKKNMLQEK